jgi:hypothetical protein
VAARQPGSLMALRNALRRTIFPTSKGSKVNQLKVRQKQCKIAFAKLQDDILKRECKRLQSEVT